MRLVGVEACAFRPAPDRGPVPVTVLDTTCEGIWLLQALCGVELLPAMLVLRPYVAAGGPPPDHPGLAVLREASAIDEDHRVHPRIAGWIEALGAPDVLLCGSLRRGADHLRLAIARRGDLHVAITRCADEVTVEEMGRVSSVRDLVRAVLPLAGPPPEPARFDPITVPTDGLLVGLNDVVQGTHTPAVAFAELGITAAQRRVLMLAADTPLADLALTIVQHDAQGDHVAKAAVTVTDTREGRIVTGPLVGEDGRWLTQISPGTEDAITRALRSLVSTLPCPAWRAHSRDG
jgi:hypothetical protein